MASFPGCVVRVQWWHEYVFFSCSMRIVCGSSSNIIMLRYYYTWPVPTSKLEKWKNASKCCWRYVICTFLIISSVFLWFELLIHSWRQASNYAVVSLWLLINPSVWQSDDKFLAVLSCGTVYYAVQDDSNFLSVDETLLCDHSSESYWAILSFCTVYYAVQGGSNFKVCWQTLVCDHSNESYWAVLSCGTDYYAVHGDSNYGRTPCMWTFKWCYSN